MEHSACFIGHRKIKDSPELRERVKKVIDNLITEKGITNFLFGDHSEFDSLCYETVTEMQKVYPHIRRIHFRKDYENAGEYTMRFLLKGYEDSICPKGVSKAGKAGYVERNQNMIRESEVCVFYYDAEYMPKRRKESCRSVTTYQPKSGTAAAYEYAVKLEKTIINVFC